MIKLLMIVGIVIGLVLIYIILITLVPGFKTQEPSLSCGKAPSESGTASTAPGRKNMSFTVKGEAISAWLYLPGTIVGIFQPDCTGKVYQRGLRPHCDPGRQVPPHASFN